MRAKESGHTVVYLPSGLPLSRQNKEKTLFRERIEEAVETADEMRTRERSHRKRHGHLSHYNKLRGTQNTTHGV